MSVYVGEVGVGWDYLCDQRYTISGKDVAYSLNVCQTRKKKCTEKKKKWVWGWANQSVPLFDDYS